MKLYFLHRLVVPPWYCNVCRQTMNICLVLKIRA